MEKTNIMQENSGTPPLFSIIVNVYNPGSLVSDCIHSILMQDLPPEEFEVIIVDDCSTDGSIEYINELTRGYRNTTTLRHMRTKCRGGAHNTGIRSARGRYIVLVDSYDYWQYSDTLSTLKQVVRDTGADIVVNTACTEVNYGSHLSPKAYNASVSPAEIAPSTLLRIHDHSRSPWNIIFRRELVTGRNIWLAEYVQYDGIDWGMRVIASSVTAVRISFPYHCRRRDSHGSDDGYLSTKSLYDRVSCYKRLYSFAKGCADRDTREYVAGWLLSGTTSLPSLARTSGIKNSRKAVSRLRESHLLSPSTYRELSGRISISLVQRLRLFLLRTMPSLLLLPAHLVWKVRRSIR